jgi:hypothetical protein
MGFAILVRFYKLTESIKSLSMKCYEMLWNTMDKKEKYFWIVLIILFILII